MCPNDKSLPLRPELPEERPHPASQPRPPFCLFPSTSPEMPLENTTAPQKSPAYYQNMRAPPPPPQDEGPKSERHALHKREPDKPQAGIQQALEAQLGP